MKTMKNQQHTHSMVESLITYPTLVVHPQDTIHSIKNMLSDSKKIGSINYVYVINHHNLLVGVISIKELFQAKNNTEVGRVMQRNVITVRPTTSPERAAHLALKHNIKSMPVVDKTGMFHGVLESDDILKILYHDFRHDMSRLGGVIPNHFTFKSLAETSIWQSLRSRIPWIGIGLIGGALIAHFLNYFEHILLEEIMFVPFIPLVVYIANAVGIQSQIFYIRDESQDPKIDNKQFLIRQIIEGIGIGLFTWLSLIIITSLLWSSPRLGFIVGLSMSISIVVSVIQAVSIPAILIKLKKDPAIGSGPFVTILQDFTSVAIYVFVVATLN